MRKSVLTAMALVAAAGAALAQPPPLPAPGTPANPRVVPLPNVVSSPDWIARPGGADLERYYPPGALKQSLSGLARISCKVTAEGRLEACVVLAEQPASAGFGEAALKLAPMFQMRPTTRDGQPVGGANVTIPIRFSVAPDAPPAPAAAAPGPSDPTVLLDRHGQKPEKSELAKFYPDRALAGGISGKAIVRCSGSAQGVLNRCEVMAEEPKRSAFGAAGLKLIETLRLPLDYETGGFVVVPLTFTSLSQSVQIGATVVYTSGVLLPVAKAGDTPPPEFVSLYGSWVLRPSSKNMEQVYPGKALSEEVNGLVIMRCVVSAEGGMRDCQIADELPTTYGFGVAALKLAPVFQIKPATQSGFPTPGAVVLIPIQFKLN